jgi:hypothetical protein
MTSPPLCSWGTHARLLRYTAHPRICLRGDEQCGAPHYLHRRTPLLRLSRLEQAEAAAPLGRAGAALRETAAPARPQSRWWLSAAQRSVL